MTAGARKTSPELAARIETAKARVLIRDAWQALGLPHPPSANQKSVRSPFREDRTPSFSLFNGGRAFKDHANPDHAGDVITFVMLATGCPRHAAVETVLHWAGDTAPAWPSNVRKAPTLAPIAAREPLKLPERGPEEPPKPPPSLSEARTLLLREEDRIAESRGLPPSACWFLSETGQLVGLYDEHNQQNLIGWVLADDPAWIAPTVEKTTFPPTARIAEARRLDRQPFKHGGKSHTLPGSKKDWPLGISALGWPDCNWLPGLSALNWQLVLVVEGGPDILAAHALVHHLGLMDVLPIALLSRETRHIHPAAAALLKGRHVHCLPHNDPPRDGRDFRHGRATAEAWARDLFWPAGVARVTFATLESLTRPDGQPAKDLCDAIEHDGLERNGSKLSEIVPQL